MRGKSRLVAMAVLALAARASIGAEDMDHSHMDHPTGGSSSASHVAMGHNVNGGNDAHAAHRAAMQATLQVTAAYYQIPDLTLRDENGKEQALHQVFASDQPVVLNFIYTSCTTICPVMTATMLQLQHELQGDEPAPRYVSISVDPDYDSAAVLRAYADRFHADWTFLTGERKAVMAVLQAFSAWRGTKANHAAITLMRRPGASDWIRVEGLSPASELARIWRHGKV